MNKWYIQPPPPPLRSGIIKVKIRECFSERPVSAILVSLKYQCSHSTK